MYFLHGAYQISIAQLLMDISSSIRTRNPDNFMRSSGSANQDTAPEPNTALENI